MRWLGDAAQPPGSFRLKEPVRPAGPLWSETSVRPQDAQSTRASRLRSATTPSQTRRALCFPSTTAMAASSSGDFATHQMQLRRQRRFCGSDVSAAAAPSAITASFAMVAPSAMAASSASRDYAKHSIMNASVSFSFWHKFAVVNDGFFGTQKALYKRPGQKRNTCQGVQKSPSARRKIVHNRKFVPKLPKSEHVFGKAGTKGRSRTKRRPQITQTSGARLPYTTPLSKNNPLAESENAQITHLQRCRRP